MTWLWQWVFQHEWTSIDPGAANTMPVKIEPVLSYSTLSRVGPFDRFWGGAVEIRQDPYQVRQPAGILIVVVLDTKWLFDLPQWSFQGFRMTQMVQIDSLDTVKSGGPCVRVLKTVQIDQKSSFWRSFLTLWASWGQGPPDFTVLERVVLSVLVDFSSNGSKAPKRSFGKGEIRLVWSAGLRNGQNDSKVMVWRSIWCSWGVSCVRVLKTPQNHQIDLQMAQNDSKRLKITGLEVYLVKYGCYWAYWTAHDTKLPDFTLSEVISSDFDHFDSFWTFTRDFLGSTL